MGFFFFFFSFLFAIRHSCSLTCWEMSSHIWSFQGEYRERNLGRRCSTGILIWQAGKNTPPSALALLQRVWRKHHHRKKPLPHFGSGGAARDLGLWGRKRGYAHFCCFLPGRQFSHLGVGLLFCSLRPSLGTLDPRSWCNSSLHTEQALGGF